MGIVIEIVGRARLKIDDNEGPPGLDSDAKQAP
jgi:hypothetical protein